MSSINPNTRRSREYRERLKDQPDKLAKYRENEATRQRKQRAETKKTESPSQTELRKISNRLRVQRHRENMSASSSTAKVRREDTKISMDEKNKLIEKVKMLNKNNIKYQKIIPKIDATFFQELSSAQEHDIVSDLPENNEETPSSAARMLFEKMTPPSENAPQNIVKPKTEDLESSECKPCLNLEFKQESLTNVTPELNSCNIEEYVDNKTVSEIYNTLYEYYSSMSHRIKYELDQ